MKISYLIDNTIFDCEFEDSCRFESGESVNLSEKFDDLTISQEWYNRGYTKLNTNDFFDFEKVYSSLSKCIFSILKGLGVPFGGKDFSLPKYHQFVDSSIHGNVILKSRSLTPTEFEFDPNCFLKAISEYFGKELNWRSDGSYEPNIIARLNLPQSKNFNPAHKDIYQVYDDTGKIPRMVNIWVPICGVNKKTGLPLAVGSHLLKENEVFRSKAGVRMNGLKYNVNSTRDWGGQNKLKTMSPNSNEMLVFSSHLIHGLARNMNFDETRVSLEFRLFEVL
jgi:hypothetical protein